MTGVRPPAPIPRERSLGPVGLFRAFRNNPIEAFTREDYAEPIVVRETLIGQIAVVADPLAVRHVLLDNAANYQRDYFQQSLLKPGLGEGLLTAEGEAWRRQRRAISGLFTPRAIAAFAGGMAAGAEALCGRWAELAPGAQVDVGGEMATATLDVLARTAFEGVAGPELAAAPAAVTGYLNSAGRLDLLDALRAPQWLPRYSVWRARRHIAGFDRLANAITDRARQQGGAADGALWAILANPDDFSEAEALGNIRTFLFAGYESTAIALAWSLLLLSLDPEWRGRAEAEVDALGESDPGGSLAAAPVTRAVVEEALRLYPPVATISRQALAADTLCGRTIRKGAVVVTAPWLCHRHQRLWDQADVFDPSRFLPGRREAIDRFAYLPFGAGARTCIGAAFALQEAVVLLSAIIRRFRLEHDPARLPTPIQRMTLRPSPGFTMRLEPRRS